MHKLTSIDFCYILLKNEPNLCILTGNSYPPKLQDYLKFVRIFLRFYDRLNPGVITKKYSKSLFLFISQISY